MVAPHMSEPTPILRGPVAPELARTTLLDAFAAHVARDPEAIAITSGDDHVDYATLERRSATLARRLLARGVGKGHPVAVCTRRRPQMPVALLGVLRAGACFLPIADEPPSDLREILDEADVRLVVAEPSTSHPFEALQRSVVYVNTEEPIDESVALPVVRPSDPAYVTYGCLRVGDRPAGIRIRHAALANLFGSLQRRPGFGEGDRMLAVAPLGLDVATLQLLLPLYCGGCVVIAPRGIVRDAVHLADLIDEEGVTIVHATPTTWHRLLAEGWPGRTNFSAWCWGEPLSRRVAGALLDRCSAVWNLYGPSEATICSLVQRVDERLLSIPTETASIPLGEPIHNALAVVLDEEHRCTPVGGSGELYIGGACLAEGYHHLPELTVGRFVVPSMPGLGDRLYRTGDRVAWTTLGHLELLGRLDRRVKIEGRPVDLEEIEVLLESNARVSRALVKGRLGDAGKLELHAYVVPSGPERFDPQALEYWLVSRLPSPTIAVNVEQVDELPVSSADKVDRGTWSPMAG